MFKSSKSTKKTYLIPVSGGMDSVFLAWKRLEEGHIVRDCYVDIMNNANKSKIELEVKEKIAEYFTAKHGERYISHTKGNKSTKFLVEYVNSNMRLKMIIPLLTGMAYALTEDITHIEMGYVMEDHAISYLDEINQLWCSMQLFGLFENDVPDIGFPLKKLNKTLIKGLMPKELFEMCVWCEYVTVEGQTCGVCSPCKTRKKHNLYVDSNDKNYGKDLKLIEGPIRPKIKRKHTYKHLVKRVNRNKYVKK